MNGYLIPNWNAPENIQAYTVLRTSHHGLLLPSEPIWLNQTHGNTIVLAEEGRGSDADASYTQKNNTVCAIRTADCLPLLITDKKGSMVAAVHAGWKSIAKNIIELDVEKFTKLNINPKELLVWLGPAISAQNYEVGEDMRDFFKEYPEGFQEIKNKPNKYFADIYKLARLRLAKLDIDPKNIYGGDLCTYSNPDLFHSARRDKESSGRIVTMIWKI
jgi:YfiH family protein